MKKKIFLITLILGAQILFPAAGENKRGIIEKSRNKFANVESLYFTQKTTTGSFSAADTFGAIDYVNEKIWAITKSGDQLIKKIYGKNSKIYIFHGISQEWFQVKRGNYHFDQGFDKDKVFLFFRKEAEDNGFILRLLKEETAGPDPCFVLESKIKDQEKAKKYLLANLETIFGDDFSRKVKKEFYLLDDYLTFYTDGFLNLIWISKKDFLPRKRKKIYNQPVGLGDSVKVQEYLVYYDFNREVKLSFPAAAQEAPTAFDKQ